MTKIFLNLMTEILSQTVSKIRYNIDTKRNFLDFRKFGVKIENFVFELHFTSNWSPILPAFVLLLLWIIKTLSQKLLLSKTARGAKT